jgi:hypothetical protein
MQNKYYHIQLHEKEQFTVLHATSFKYCPLPDDGFSKKPKHVATHSKIYNPVLRCNNFPAINGRDLFSCTLITFRVTMKLSALFACLPQNEITRPHTRSVSSLSFLYLPITRYCDGRLFFVTSSRLRIFKQGKTQTFFLWMLMRIYVMSLKWSFHYRIEPKLPTRRRQMITGITHVL